MGEASAHRIRIIRFSAFDAFSDCLRRLNRQPFDSTAAPAVSSLASSLQRTQSKPRPQRPTPETVHHPNRRRRRLLGHRFLISDSRCFRAAIDD
ncbi:hypothetical protein L1987_54955 [Smallanthus sonchifolius]|uniref:Uncharacterized protein n=1 Tax=Smallanthus sonchifolius TaxID=185202 RepID=A0ACB9E8H5_9ASTR|nr:hypothetical protein L1987_54955 [Smallanthus sonchifolius]